MKTFSKKSYLTHALLASTLFVSGLALADNFSGAQINLDTSGTSDGIINLLATGQITGTGNQSAVDLDNTPSTANILTLQPFNTFAPSALAVFNAIGNKAPAVNITESGSVTIYNGSGITNADFANKVSAINISNGATATILNFGVIQGDLHAIGIDTTAFNENVTITNKTSGVIQNFSAANAAGAVIFSGDDSNNLTFTLNNDGLIQQTGSTKANFPLNLVDLTANLLNGSIVNTGQMLITDSGNTGSVISFLADDATSDFSIWNKSCGLMSTIGTGNVILLNPNNNNGVTGIIQNDGMMFSVEDTINLQDFVGGILNNGTIFAESPTDAAIFVTNGVTLNQPITLPSGVIQKGIVNNGDIMDATIIFNAAPGAEKVAIDIDTNGNNITFYQNAGNVIGDVFLAPSDSDGSANHTVFFMNGGTIAGDVYASENDSNTLTLNTGTILGNVVLYDVDFDTVILSDTKVSGVIDSGSQGFGNPHHYVIQALPGNTVANGSFNGLFGANWTDTLDVNNTFTANGFVDSVDTININGTSAATPTVLTQNNLFTNIGTHGGDLNINDFATLVQNRNISFTNGTASDLEIRNGGTLLVNKAVQTQMGGDGTNTTSSHFEINNGGTLEIGATGVETILGYNSQSTRGLFEAHTGGTYKVHVEGYGTPLSSGQALVNNAYDTDNFGIVFSSGSFIQPVLDDGFVPQGQQFNIVVDENANSIEDNGVTVLPTTSASVQFHKQSAGPNDSILQLVADVTPFADIIDGQGVKLAEVFDTFAATVPTIDPGLPGDLPVGFNPLVVGFLGQLQLITTEEGLEEAIEAALPNFNYGLIEASHFGMNTAFDGAVARLEDLRGARHHRHHHKHHKPYKDDCGTSYGDNYARAGGWVELIGGHFDQKERREIDGYKIDAGGIAIGADWDLNDCVLLGLSASYTKADVDDKDDFAPKDTNVKSWQGMAYGWFEFRRGWYADAAFAVAHNDYDTNRYVPLTTGDSVNDAAFIADPCVEATFTPTFFNAEGDFDGTQYGAQLNVGWRWMNNDSYYFAPFARLRFIHIDFDDYNETGADVFNLAAVSNDDSTEFQGGLGFRFGGRFGSGDVTYVPELTAMVAYDFTNDGQQTTFTLFDLPAVELDAVKPGRTTFNLGLGLNVHVVGDSIFSIKYNLDIRDQFVGNSGWVRYTYLWH